MKSLILNILILGTVIFTVSCVQETYKRQVNFVVDMSGVATYETVGIRGGFEPLSWKEDLRLSDTDGDQLYRATVTFDTPFDYTEVKFIIDGEQYELQDEDNRKVYFNKEGITEYSCVFDSAGE